MRGRLLQRVGGLGHAWCPSDRKRAPAWSGRRPRMRSIGRERLFLFLQLAKLAVDLRQLSLLVGIGDRGVGFDSDAFLEQLEDADRDRSEERRVGKEWRSGWAVVD